MQLQDNQQITLSWKVGAYRYPVKIHRMGNRLWFNYAYNKTLTAILKDELEGIKWHGFEEPPIKNWSALYNHHNRFRIDFHTGGKPYSIYDRDYKTVEFEDVRPLKQHQINMAKHALSARRLLIAGEMGVGKTLAMIAMMEASKITDWFWVGPKSGIYSVKLDFKKWKSVIYPRFMTYNELTALATSWVDSNGVARGIIFDESHCIKTPGSQRTRAAKYFADLNYEIYKDDGIVVLMTGTPAPKSPLDWYAQCEIARAGFLRERDHHTFKTRLAILSEGSNATGGSFNQIIGWKDDEKKCSTCGLLESDPIHEFHIFAPVVNEVALLYRRMNGLVHIVFKKDCLDLPDKIFRKIVCKVAPEVQRAANLIIKSGKSTIQVLTLLRELSDGFMYEDVQTGTQTCDTCNGKKLVKKHVYTGQLLDETELESICLEKGIFADSDAYYKLYPYAEYPDLYTLQDADCDSCYGTGERETTARSAKELGSSKDDVVRDLLQEFADTKRAVLFAGFTGSIDRLTSIIKQEGWEYIRVDGRGWTSSFGSTNAEELLTTFQDKLDTRRIAFIGHPGSAGVGITLTASSMAVFYSNDFNAVNRQQAMDRIHRLGMDENRGATIIDLVCLPSDEYIIKNLDNKARLQDITLGKLKTEIQELSGKNVDVYE
jgi:SNF2 family DNA or RNA helicase